jgi:hypothetical protein
LLGKIDEVGGGAGFELVLDVFEIFCYQHKPIPIIHGPIRHANCTGCRIKVTLYAADDI